MNTIKVFWFNTVNQTRSSLEIPYEKEPTVGEVLDFLYDEYDLPEGGSFFCLPLGADITDFPEIGRETILPLGQLPDITKPGSGEFSKDYDLTISFSPTETKGGNNTRYNDPKIKEASRVLCNALGELIGDDNPVIDLIEDLRDAILNDDIDFLKSFDNYEKNEVSVEDMLAEFISNLY